MPNNSTLYTLFTLSAPRRNIDLKLPAVGSEMPQLFCMQKVYSHLQGESLAPKFDLGKAKGSPVLLAPRSTGCRVLHTRDYLSALLHALLRSPAEAPAAADQNL